MCSTKLLRCARTSGRSSWGGDTARRRFIVGGRVENFVDAAFARLDHQVPDETAAPTTYPTPSRRCYRYADGAATYYAACGEDEPFLVVGAVAEYRGACVNEDAVDACLAAARCSIIDAEAVGPPDACGDAIKGRVHRV